MLKKIILVTATLFHFICYASDNPQSTLYCFNTNLSDVEVHIMYLSSAGCCRSKYRNLGWYLVGAQQQGKFKIPARATQVNLFIKRPWIGQDLQETNFCMGASCKVTILKDKIKISEGDNCDWLDLMHDSDHK